MTEKQKTIREKISISGIGLHTGCQVTVCLIPSEDNSGIRFRRTDVPESSVIEAKSENVIQNSGLPRCTTIGRGAAVIHTVEHLMAVLCGMGIDNLLIEINAKEMPGLDGSGLEFLRAIKNVGMVEQSAVRQYIDITEPLAVYCKGSSLFIVPSLEYEISYALDYNHEYLGDQLFEAVINTDNFEKEIAPCRTFCLQEEAAQLQARGLGKGASYKNTLVVGQEGVIENEVRFEDEFARHKVLDFIGDLYLLGRPIRGHVFAFKSGHDLNIALLMKIDKLHKKFLSRQERPKVYSGKGKKLDVHQIMQILPHRYPFLLVDRIIDLEPGLRAVAVKNVTADENFFNGHFPTRPIMPGVLMVEALAQVGGVVVLTSEQHRGKLGLFMAADNVKFRKVVSPGDQLVMEVEVIRDRSRIALVHGTAMVDGEIVTEADLTFSYVESSFLNP